MTDTGTSTRAYVVTFVALLVLLAATLVAAALPLGHAATPVALAIAGAKAALVGLVFMQLARRGGVTRLFALGGFLWLVLLFALTFADYATRDDALVGTYSWSHPERAPAGAPPPEPEERPEVVWRRHGRASQR